MGTYLVTGAAGGIGDAICRALKGKGHEVWGIDRAEPASPVSWGFIKADVTKTDQLEKAAETIGCGTEGLDGIVHAAGLYDLDSLVEIGEERFLRDFDVNVFGAYRINKLFLPLMRPAGRILIITSELAPLDPLPFTGIYAVTKAALDQYAAALRAEVQLLGHQVTVVRPGAVRTGLLPDSVRQMDRFCGETKLYRLHAGRFRQIVNQVETKSIPPEKLAERIVKTIEKGKAPLVLSVNRSPFLLLLNALPDRMQLWIIRRILT